VSLIGQQIEGIIYKATFPDDDDSSLAMRSCFWLNLGPKNFDVAWSNSASENVLRLSNFLATKKSLISRSSFSLSRFKLKSNW